MRKTATQSDWNDTPSDEETNGSQLGAHDPSADETDGAHLTSDNANTGEKVDTGEEDSEPHSENDHPTVGGFKLSDLRVPQNFLNTGGVKKHVTTVLFKKAHKTEWFCVHPAKTHRMAAWVLKDVQDLYVVSAELAVDLVKYVSLMMLYTCMTRQGDLFVWAARLPSDDGRVDTWAESAIAAAELGTTSWVRIVANMAISAYECVTPSADIPLPEFPPMSFEEILHLALKGRVINSADHPVLRRLRGEVWPRRS